MSFRAHELRVLHRDAHYLVLDKPVGIATTAPEGGESLFSLAQELDARAPQLHPLSRLDTQVSGIVTFARTAEANHCALEARRNGKMARRYLALTAHTLTAQEGEWTWSIAIDPRDPKKRVAIEPGARGMGVKNAATRFVVRAVREPLTALDLYPLTGRTHQLRVHAARAGFPLFGDVAYGGEKRLTLANGRILTGSRVMLHCASVRMPTPSGSELQLTLDPPHDMLELWQRAFGVPRELAEPEPQKT
jgi:23S rRNA-/tRNA-specific pseudouridylate synthase